ncbi:MAG: hypothetical protein ACRDFX_09705 [Chloroflexota bacterium]
MITDASASAYAQTGYILNYGQSQPVIFAEYRDKANGCGADFCDAYGPVTYQGNVHQYYEDYDTAYGFRDMDMGYDNTFLNSTSYDPVASGVNHWAGPWGHQFYGENINYGDNMPGRSTSHVYFENVSWVPNINTTGALPPSTQYLSSENASSSRPYYCVSRLEAYYEFAIWTDGNCPPAS